MTPTKANIERLIASYMEQPGNKALQQALAALLEDEAAHSLVLDVLATYMETNNQMPQPNTEVNLEAIFENIMWADKPHKTVAMPARRMQWWKYAAAILLIATSAVWLWTMVSKPGNPAPAEGMVSHSMEIAPGKEGAILQLEDGTQIVLDSIGQGVVKATEGLEVKIEDGILVYAVKASALSDKGKYHTMITPKGRQFKLELPDGSKVWLNASSSIRFPTVFDTDKREVTITGELYFDVATLYRDGDKKNKVPFTVMMPHNNRIDVVGTQFNVNAYADEKSITTTLVSGKVQVQHGASRVLLQPGKQAIIKNTTVPDNSTPMVVPADIAQVVAWKEGLFDFENASLEEVMRQLERWYDIEVQYENGIPPFEFVGRIGRDLSLATVLRGLELSKVRFRMEGDRKLIVY